jgi:hypothetical protein
LPPLRDAILQIEKAEISPPFSTTSCRPTPGPHEAAKIPAVEMLERLAISQSEVSPADLNVHDCIVGRRQGNRSAWLLKQPDGSIARHAVSVKHELQDFEMVQRA